MGHCLHEPLHVTAGSPLPGALAIGIAEQSPLAERHKANIHVYMNRLKTYISDNGQ